MSSLKSRQQKYVNWRITWTKHGPNGMLLQILIAFILQFGCLLRLRWEKALKLSTKNISQEFGSPSRECWSSFEKRAPKYNNNYIICCFRFVVQHAYTRCSDSCQSIALGIFYMLCRMLPTCYKFYTYPYTIYPYTHIAHAFINFSTILDTARLSRQQCLQNRW